MRLLYQKGRKNTSFFKKCEFFKKQTAEAKFFNDAPAAFIRHMAKNI
jgi:hypothetical protein